MTETILSLARILGLYAVIVLGLFVGLMMLARAFQAVAGRPVWTRGVLVGTALLYAAAAVVFVIRPTLAIPVAVVAIVASVAWGLLWQRRRQRGLSEPELALLFVLPAVMGIFLFYYYQIAQTFIYSFHQLDHTTKWTSETFIGLENYVTVFGSPNFLSALGYTLYFTAVAVFLELVVGLGMALATFWINRHLTGVLRSMIVIPWAIPPIISAAIWKWFYNADVGLGTLLVQLGITETPPLFLIDPFLARHSVIAADIWKNASMMAILLIGGLAIIPQDIYDAAKVDGARAFFRFRRVTLPMLTPTIMVAVLFRAMDALRTFDLIYGLTKGGPGISTETLSSFAYKYYFSRAQFGQGSAYGVVVFLIILLLGMVYLQQLRKNLRFR